MSVFHVPVISPFPLFWFVWAGSISFSGTILPLILLVPGLVTYALATVHMYMLETGGYSTSAVPTKPNLSTWSSTSASVPVPPSVFPVSLNLVHVMCLHTPVFTRMSVYFRISLVFNSFASLAPVRPIVPLTNTQHLGKLPGGVPVWSCALQCVL